MARRRSRTERRALERSADKLWQQNRKLALLEPGGTPERPLEVTSASVVEGRAEAEPCLRCDSAVRTIEHRADVVGGQRLRIARVRCPRCGAERTYHFRLRASEMS